MYDKIAREMFLAGFICVSSQDVEDYLRYGHTEHITSEEAQEIEKLLEQFI